MHAVAVQLSEAAEMRDYQQRNFSEDQRLEALISYRLLDTKSEKSYNNIVSLVATLCETPIALISLVDKDRQWFKAQKGMTINQTPRDVSLCTHAIKNPHEIMIIEDAANDERFSNNPLVVGENGFRFYAGCPLTTSRGLALGTLCVIDTKPRTLTALQKQSLRTFADNIVSHFELHKANVERIRVTSELAKTQLEMEAFAYAASHDLKSPLRGIDNLATWIKEDAQELDDESNERIAMIQGRISRLDNLLDSISGYYQTGRNVDVKERVNLKHLASDLITAPSIPKTFNMSAEAIVDHIEVPRNLMERVLNHLIGNAIKHHDKDTGNVSISAGLRGDFIEVAVSDDGPGIPEEFHAKIFKMFQTLKPRDAVEGAGMGLALVEKIIVGAGGKIWIEPNAGCGTTFVFTWPKGL